VTLPQNADKKVLPFGRFLYDVGFAHMSSGLRPDDSKGESRIDITIFNIATSKMIRALLRRHHSGFATIMIWGMLGRCGGKATILISYGRLENV
jgi:hypothetical protein